MTDLAGGCACGQIRFMAKGAYKFAFFCQCRSCQKMTGSGHAAQFCHDRSTFSVTGAPAQWSRKTDAGETVTKSFCQTCGAPLFGTTTRAPGIVMVLAGALDSPAVVRPDRVFFAENRVAWDDLQRVGAAQEQQPRESRAT